MSATMTQRTIVLPGHRIEIIALELPEGVNVEVQITLPAENDAASQRFDALARRWRGETAALSSVSQIAMHPAYQEIIGLGRGAAPLILREMQRQPGHWFWALRAITGQDPARPEQRGNVAAMGQSAGLAFINERLNYNFWFDCAFGEREGKNR